MSLIGIQPIVPEPERSFQLPRLWILKRPGPDVLKVSVHAELTCYRELWQRRLPTLTAGPDSTPGNCASSRQFLNAKVLTSHG